MQFGISRTSTSIWDEDSKPCDGAKYKDSKWQIEITTLDELLDLAHKYGEIIILPIGAYRDRDELEIYDSCRE